MLCLDLWNGTHRYSRIPTADLRFILHLSDLNSFTTTHGNRIERLHKQFLKLALLPLRLLDPIPSYHHQRRLVHLPSLEHRRSILAIWFISDLLDGGIICPGLLSNVGFYAPSRQLQNFDHLFLELRRTNYFQKESLCKALYESNALRIDMQFDYFSSKSILKHRLVYYFINFSTYDKLLNCTSSQ